jgi:hypothetical protein
VFSAWGCNLAVGRLRRLEAAQLELSGTAVATQSMKLAFFCAQVAAMDARVWNVFVPAVVLLPQESLRAMTAGRSWSRRRGIGGIDAGVIQECEEMVALLDEAVMDDLLLAMCVGQGE